MWWLFDLIADFLAESVEDFLSAEDSKFIRTTLRKGLGWFRRTKGQWKRLHTYTTRKGLEQQVKKHVQRALKNWSTSQQERLRTQLESVAETRFKQRTQNQIYQLKRQLAKLKTKAKQKVAFNPELIKKYEQQLQDLENKKNTWEERQLQVDLTVPQNLSSSWLLVGVLVKYKDNNTSGTLTLTTKKGRIFFIPNCPLSIWFSMVKAYGSWGSGAGSVLWDTLWQPKRTLSLKTGGIVKTNRLRAIRRARTLKQTKYFERQYQHPTLAWHSLSRLQRDFMRNKLALRQIGQTRIRRKRR